jgi:transposase InsO family protein
MGNALSPRKRELVLAFDPVLAGMSVGQFCRVNGIGRSSFYRLRARAEAEGVAAALVPRSRAPHRPARRFGVFTDEAITVVRGQLESEGVEAGPWSIWWRMLQSGVDPVPSRSTIARRLRLLGLVTATPSKRPRSSYKRFTRSAANELWQLDGIEWSVAGQRVTIYQVVDDCTRLMTALTARSGAESSTATQQVLAAAFAWYGSPAAVLTDNGAAFNQHRRGRLSSTEIWLARQGIRPISGRVGHPQTQGKIERAHQPVQRWLDKHPVADLDQLDQTLQAYRSYYNRQRQHQGLGIRITPFMAWEAKAASRARPAEFAIPLDQLYGQQPLSLPAAPTQPVLTSTRVRPDGKMNWQGRVFWFARDTWNQPIHLVQTPDQLTIFETDGTVHAQIPWPAPRPTRQSTINLTKPPYRIKPLSQKS